MQLFLWSVIIALSGVKTHSLTSLLEKSHNTQAHRYCIKIQVPGSTNQQLTQPVLQVLDPERLWEGTKEHGWQLANELTKPG